MSSERTEEPTPKKLKKAREQGQVPKSRELPSALLLLTAAVALGASGEGMQADFAAALDVALRATRCWHRRPQRRSRSPASVRARAHPS
jgi:flagellar biosynthesis protein FlhB